MRGKFEESLDQLTKQGILELVQLLEWVAHIVLVLKADKTVRICSDFMNHVTKVECHTIPRVEDLLATIKSFTKLDLRDNYQQLVLDEASLVINTHRDLFRYTRLPFGVSSAPGIFQRVTAKLLQGIPHVVMDIDDINYRDIR